MLSADVRVTPAHWCTTDCKNFNDLLMILFVFRLVQSTCAASPSPAFFWLLRPVRRTRWTQTPRHTCRNTHIIRQTLRLEPHDYVFLLKHNFCCLLHLASALFWWFRTPKTPFENSTDSVLVLKLKALLLKQKRIGVEVALGAKKKSMESNSSCNCVCVCVCGSVCAFSEGLGFLQQLWLFSVRDPEDGEDHSGQTQLGSAHGHSTGFPAHRTSVTHTLALSGIIWAPLAYLLNPHWTLPTFWRTVLNELLITVSHCGSDPSRWYSVCVCRFLISAASGTWWQKDVTACLTTDPAGWFFFVSPPAVYLT